MSQLFIAAIVDDQVDTGAKMRRGRCGGVETREDLIADGFAQGSQVGEGVTGGVGDEMEVAGVFPGAQFEIAVQPVNRAGDPTRREGKGKKREDGSATGVAQGFQILESGIG